MPCLSVFSTSDPQQPNKVLGWPAHVSATLAELGVRYVQCVPAQPLHRASSDAEVLEAYAELLAQLLGMEDGLSVQLVRISHDQHLSDAPHGHYLDEHIHREAECHLFVAGQALLSLHAGDTVYQLLCEQGDLLVIPAGTRHWLEYDHQENGVAIRVLGSAEGSRVEPGDPSVADRFPRLVD